MFGRFYIFFVFAIYLTQPAIILKQVAESKTFDGFDNFVPRYDEPVELSVVDDQLIEETAIIEKNDKAKSLEEFMLNNNSQHKHWRCHKEAIESVKIGFVIYIFALYLRNKWAFQISSTDKNTSMVTSIAMPNITSTTNTSHSTTNFESNDTAEVKSGDDIFPNFGNETNRIPRQDMNDTEDDPEFKSEEKESQENGSSSEENMNMLTGLISAFLGGFSKPDGGIDVDAIVGLLGSLSTQNNDGSYDFQGLTDLLRGFFGGEGGSDVGAFAGGLLGAVIKGVANPPGAKGAGKLTGKIFAGILPALSGPPDSDIEDLDGNKTPSKGGLDSGAFIVGLLKTILASSSGQGGPKINIVKTIFTSIASLFTSSSTKQ